MEPESLVIEQLKAIRASIEDNGRRIEDNGRRIDELRGDVQTNTRHLEVAAGEVGEIKLHMQWLRAQVSAASTQASVADTGRARLQSEVDALRTQLHDVVARIDALEGKH
jgi:chromosome segregation ATPase